MLLCWIVVEWDCFVGLLLSVNVMRRWSFVVARARVWCWIVVEWDCFVGCVNVMRRWSFVVARARVWLHVHVVVCTCVVVVGCLHVCGCYV